MKFWRFQKLISEKNLFNICVNELDRNKKRKIQSLDFQNEKDKRSSFLNIRIFRQFTLLSLDHQRSKAQFNLCIAENKDPPNTPATPSMWKGCIRIFKGFMCFWFIETPFFFRKRIGLYHQNFYRLLNETLITLHLFP